MTITYRQTKGSALTYEQLDENFRDLREDTTLNRVLLNGNSSNASIVVGNLTANTLTVPSITFSGTTGFIANTNPVIISYDTNVSGTVTASGFTTVGAGSFGSISSGSIDVDTITYNSMSGSTHVATLSGTVTPNFNSYTHFVWTLTGNITLGNPSTELIGQSGIFVFVHSGAARTVSLSSEYDCPTGILTLSSVSGYTDIVPYFVSAAGRVILGQSTKNIT
jgi:hypothetical protein